MQHQNTKDHITDSGNLDLQNAAFQNALHLIQYTHQSLFLTGKAGTGKSTFLKYICQNTRKKHVVLAPTGIAAVHVGGVTLHSFFKLPFHPLLPDDPRYTTRNIRNSLKYNQSLCKLIQEVELIIIDEISMVRADIIDFIDKVLRIYSRQTRLPFGGKQMILVGDIFQLEPVVKTDERELLRPYYSSLFFFSAHVFQSMKLISIELQKIYRQNDPVFISLLDRVRLNATTDQDLYLINQRVQESPGNGSQRGSEEISITLAARRNVVDYINQQELDKLEGETCVMTGEIKGEFPESSLPTSLTLNLKTGAQVLFIKNDMEKRWVNGTLGIIEDIDVQQQVIHVITEQGESFAVNQERWSNIRYRYNAEKKEIEEEELGVFIQFPIKLAWAITIHKSQGLTFRKVCIDFSGGIFAGGQTYVALSRCRSLQGIDLKQPIQRKDIFVRPEILRFAHEFNNQKLIQQALQTAQADIAYQEAISSFNKGDMSSCLDQFFKAIHLRYDIETERNKRFIRYKLSRINQLQEENKQLRRKMQEQQESLKKYADEYYLMGNECILHGRHVTAALANYDKAIELYPQHVDAWVRKGVTFFEEKQHHEAESCFNKAIQYSPLLFKGWYNRAKNRYAINRLEEALGDIDKAVSLKPDHIGARILYGNILAQTGKEQEAAIQWSIAEELRNKKKKKQ